jgi:hypothetical protein
MDKQMPAVIKDAQLVRGVCLYPVQQMSEGCWLATDSGGNKRYVVGYLDNGSPFCERARNCE